MEASKSEMAEMLNVSRPTFYSMVRQGMPVESNGKCNVKKCLEWQHVHPSGGIKPGPISTTADDSGAQQTLLALRLRIQQATAEFAEQRAKQKAGETLSRTAAALLVSHILWKLFSNMDSVPLKTLHLGATDQYLIITIDGIYRDSIRRGFRSAVSAREIKETLAKFTERADALAKVLEAAITMKEVSNDDAEDLGAALDFITEIRSLFFDMSVLSGLIGSGLPGTLGGQPND